MQSVDVVVVGAGAAGLAAAHVLRQEGLNFAVLEAMGRVGGRAYTSSEHFGMPFDMGCAWIHAADRNPFYADAERAGWTLYHHDMNVDRLYFGKRAATDSEIVAMKAADAEIARRIEAHNGPDDRLSAVLQKGAALRAAATFCGPMDFGMDEDEISVADYKVAADLDPNYFTREGYGALVAHWGMAIPVHLSTPVRRIDWSGSARKNPVKVTTDRGTLYCKAVIVTCSPAVLALGHIEFSPELPDDYTEAFFDLPMGMLTKIPIEIRGERFGLNPFDDLLIERPARHDIFFLCFPFDTDLMVGFIGGDFAWEMSVAGEAAGVDFTIDRLAGIFGSDLRKHVVRSTMTNWGAEPHIRGAYAAARPGRSGARITLAHPVENRIFFAGEHLAGPLIQTCGGARLSGEAVARAAIGAMR